MAKKKKGGAINAIGKTLIFTSTAVMYMLKGLYTFLDGIGSAILFTSKKVNEKRAKTTKKAPAKNRPKTTAKYTSLKDIKPIKGKSTTFENFFHNSDSTIGIILGARGTGKSAIGLKLLENAHAKAGKQVYAIGFNAKDIPNWINAAETPEEVENDSIVLIDESGISFSSRKSMSNANQLLSSLLMIARHKNISVLFITQNSSNLEVNVLRQADFLVMKPSSLMQKDFERKKIKEVYESMQPGFEELKGTTGLTYIHSDKYQGFVTNDLPSFWTTSVSKAFKEK
ncbi:AAA family ATPase [Candidatus Woesearchaeota archaeon]|nr:AAA family ATPase [Candidatus Woesearchaeota archaeon]MBW3005756.1 AAA family ATPase [Candidatus Woesearchaeota archaeon]